MQRYKNRAYFIVTDKESFCYYEQFLYLICLNYVFFIVLDIRLIEKIVPAWDE